MADEDLPSGPAVASHDPDVAVEPAEGDDPAVEFEINLDEGDSESPRRSRGVNPSGDDEEDEDEGELFDFSNFDLSKNIGAFTPNVLRGMGLTQLGKNENARKELAEKGMAVD